jgi:hypothetical protein
MSLSRPADDSAFHSTNRVAVQRAGPVGQALDLDVGALG